MTNSFAADDADENTKLNSQIKNEVAQDRAPCEFMLRDDLYKTKLALAFENPLDVSGISDLLSKEGETSLFLQVLQRNLWVLEILY